MDKLGRKAILGLPLCLHEWNLLYLPFLISLTIFALLVLTPETKPCKWFIFFSVWKQKRISTYGANAKIWYIYIPYHQIKTNIMGTSHLWGDMLMPTQPL